MDKAGTKACGRLQTSHNITVNSLEAQGDKTQELD